MAKGKIAAKLAGATRGAEAALRGRRGIFRELDREHAELTTTMRRIARTADPDMKRELFEEVQRELLAHGKGEEREFYPLLRTHEEACELVEEALDDHRAIETMLERLRAMDVRSDEWVGLFDELVNEVEEHVAQERNEIFPLAEQLIDEELSKKLVERYLNSKKQVAQRVA